MYILNSFDYNASAITQYFPLSDIDNTETSKLTGNIIEKLLGNQ